MQTPHHRRARADGVYANEALLGVEDPMPCKVAELGLLAPETLKPGMELVLVVEPVRMIAMASGFNPPLTRGSSPPPS
jgi:hypothetical protein